MSLNVKGVCAGWFRAGADRSLQVSGMVWWGVLAFVAGSYAAMFMVVHPVVDTRQCQWHIPDPVLPLVPHDPSWNVVVWDLYYVMTVLGVLGMAMMAIRGAHRLPLRFGCGLAFMALFRSMTLLLVPACRPTEVPGTAALASQPFVDVGGVQIPLRIWAVNDMVFSGHVGEFLILYLVLRKGPRWILAGLWVWQIVLSYALLATRDHYLVDMVVAVPFAFLCDWLSRIIVDRLPSFVPHLESSSSVRRTV